MILRLCLILTCCYLSLTRLQAQPGTLLSPDEFLGYEHGTRFTAHHRLVEYFEHVAEVSDKVDLTIYGRTYESRPLIATFISSPGNLKRLDEIRLNNLHRTGLVQGQVFNENIAIVYLSYSIHGDEAAGSESSMSVLYDLAKGGDNIDQWLENTIVIIDPSLNPDGYARYSQWNNSVSNRFPDPLPDAREHDEPWPSGRTNHYYIDLNRDWVWRSQIETRYRLDFYQHWMPHIHADLHEMHGDATYYFAPAAQPYHPYLTKWQSEFQTDIGKNHASYFDKQGWLYFTKEDFDLFYPSYGDTYPMLSGAIGMTYEQSDNGRGGRALIMPGGGTVTLAERIAHHHTTSLSTIEVASKNASKLISEFTDYFKKAIEDPAGPYRSYVISSSNNKGRMHDLFTLLDAHKIRYGVIDEEHKALKGFGYTEGEIVSFVPAKGDIVIPSAQPRSALLHALFEPEASLADSVTYDITAWSLPMAYGLKAYATSETIPYTSYKSQAANSGSFPEKPFAYAIEWGSVASSNLLATMVMQGITARYASEDFRVDGKNFKAGTILITRADNREIPDFDQQINSLSRNQVASIEALSTGFVETGKDLGSQSFIPVRKPSVLSIAGEGVHSSGIGQIWHFFEEKLVYPITLIEPDKLDQVVLHQFNVIILPEGSYQLNPDVHQKIMAWVRAGGQLITMGSSIHHFAGKEGIMLKSKTGELPEIKITEEQAHFPEAYRAGMRNSISGEIGGAVFRTRIDPTHPLSFGLGEAYWSLKISPVSYGWLPSGGNAIYLDDKPVHYGFAGTKALSKVSRSLIAGREQIGSGGIVYFVDNPLFRSFWNSGKVLFSNALFF